MNRNPIDVITLVGKLSGTEVRVKASVVVELCKAYMVIIPNERKTMDGVLAVTRFYDEFTRVFSEEEKAIENNLDKRLARETL